METSTWFSLLAVLLWLLAVMLSAVSIKSAGLSEYERGRRIKAGDQEAMKQDERESLLPRLHALRRIVLAVVIVLATAVTIAAFGWLLGTLIASILSLVLGVMARSRQIARLVERLYEPREATLLELVAGWGWLDALRGTDVMRPDIIAASKPELEHIIARSSHVLSRDESLRLRASLTLDEHVVSDIMTPVSVVDTADSKDALGPLVIDSLHKTGHSRFPVIDGDIHHVVGMLYLHDIINLKSAKSTVESAMDPRVHYIHEAQSLEHALHGFLRTHRHLFIVVNDFRETVGVLALEDVLEKLLGKKIVDEFDAYDDLRAVAASNPRKNNVPKQRTDV